MCNNKLYKMWIKNTIQPDLTFEKSWMAWGKQEESGEEKEDYCLKGKSPMRMSGTTV